MFHFYTSWKRKKTIGFLAFLGGIEMELWLKRISNDHFYILSMLVVFKENKKKNLSILRK